MEMLFEHVLTMRERGNLPDSAYGLPEDKKYPLTDKEHVLKAIQYFGSCPDKKMHILASNINKKIKEYKMNVNVSETNKFYKYYVPYDETVKENLLEIENEDISGIEDIIQESSFMYDKSVLNDIGNVRFLIIKYLKWVRYMVNKEKYVCDIDININEEPYIVLYALLDKYINSDTKNKSIVLDAIIKFIDLCCNEIDTIYIELILAAIQLESHPSINLHLNEFNTKINMFINNIDDNSKDKVMGSLDPIQYKRFLSGIELRLPILEKYYIDKKIQYSFEKYIIKSAYIVYDKKLGKNIVMSSIDDVDITDKFNNVEMRTLNDILADSIETKKILDKYKLSLELPEMIHYELTKYLRVNESDIITIELNKLIIMDEPDMSYEPAFNRITFNLQKENNKCEIVGMMSSENNILQPVVITIIITEGNFPAISNIRPIIIQPDYVDFGKSTTEGLYVNPNGSIRYTIKPKKTYMDEYSEAHRILVENYNNKNYQGVKDNLCFIFTLIATIEREVIYSKKKVDEIVKKDAIDARALAINDFKTYLKKLQSVDKDFDFTSYYERSNYGKLVINVTPDTIKGIKKLFNLILLA